MIDHILLLQTSLYHYEYILSHCQPAYLSHLSVAFSLAKGGTDKAILALSVVSIGVLPMQVLIGKFST
jgi:magnesium transporter